MKDGSHDCGPAFPQSMVDMGNGPEDPNPLGMGGMPLRDYFAGQAIIGFCSLPNSDGVRQWDYKTMSEDAYGLADAMLTERIRSKNR